MGKKGKTAREEEPKPGARPDYDRVAIMGMVCALMAEGQSLRRICSSVDGMPKHSTICGWMIEEKELADQYTRARALLSDYRFDEFRDAAAEIVKRYIGEGWEPKDAIAMAKLETSNMQWELSKLNPKKYGDKLELDNKHSGAIGVPELNVYVNGVLDGPDPPPSTT